jgi:short-subunit dehydrogenase
MANAEGPRPVALVTGASAGLGAAYAERLAGDGFDLIVVARREERLRSLAERLAAGTGVEVDVVAADLTEPEQLADVERRVAGEPRLRLLVNNAGFAGYMPFVALPPEVADGLIDLHVRAATRLTRASVPGMRERGTGSIVNVASLLAFSHPLPPNPLPYRSVYAACKAYLVAFSFVLQRELEGSGVRIQVCCPGLVDTEFHDLAGVDRSRFRVTPMPAEDVVRASLRGLELGEVLCAPGLQDPSLVDKYLDAQVRLLREGNATTLADRYEN